VIFSTFGTGISGRGFGHRPRRESKNPFTLTIFAICTNSPAMPGAWAAEGHWFKWGHPRDVHATCTFEL
jgi:hypothetical protein